MSKWKRLVLFSIVLRLIVLFLVFLFDSLFEDYDTSASIHIDCSREDPRAEVKKPSPLEGLIVWDTVFYHRIYQCGYEYEHHHAFFPGLPSTLGVIARLMRDCGPGCFVLIGLIVNNAAFVLSTVIFQQLSEKVIGDPIIVRTATMLYCLMPASVFTAVVYTESLFGLLTLMGLWSLYCQDRLWMASLFFALTGCYRSNGILNVGFLLHYQLKKTHFGVQATQVLLKAIAAAVTVTIALSPFIAWQYIGFVDYCNRPTSATDFKPPSWCSKAVPYIYGHVQKTYWNVGFLRYYERKQIPNFLLAAPSLFLGLHGWMSYIKSNPYNCLGLGKRSGSKDWGSGYNGMDVAPFVWHCAFMTLFALLFMHVQVTTRFLSSCPAFYWYAAELSRDRTRRKMIVFVFLSYIFLGALLFPNFYPWT